MSREDPDLMPAGVGLSRAFALDQILALLCHATVMTFGYCPFALGEIPPPQCVLSLYPKEIKAVRDHGTVERTEPELRGASSGLGCH